MLRLRLRFFKFSCFKRCFNTKVGIILPKTVVDVGYGKCRFIFGEDGFFKYTFHFTGDIYKFSELFMIFFFFSYGLLVLNIFRLKSKVSEFFFFKKYFYFQVLKAHGINMRFKVVNRSILYIRVGYSHGFYINIPSGIHIRVFKRRYVLLIGYNRYMLNSMVYHIRAFRNFFQYKLIGVKLIRDIFKIKIGKKKAF